MHKQGFTHRDLKPDNVLVMKVFEDGRSGLVAKVADLALACKPGPDGMASSPIPDKDELELAGSKLEPPMPLAEWSQAEYVKAGFYPRCYYFGDCGMVWGHMAPENLFESQKSARGGSCQQYFPLESDVWNLGLVLHDLLGGQTGHWMLGWAFNIANQMTADAGEPPIVLPSYFKDVSPIPLPSLGFDEMDERFGGKGCISKLLRGTLAPMPARISSTDAVMLAADWLHGIECSAGTDSEINDH